MFVWFWGVFGYHSHRSLRGVLGTNISVHQVPLLDESEGNFSDDVYTFFFSFQKFKSLLIQELTKVFPEDMAKYKAIRGEDPPP